jgi:hypothetical protein
MQPPLTIAPYRPRSAKTNERGRTLARSAAQVPQAPGATQIAFSTGTSASSGVFAQWGRSGPQAAGRPFSMILMISHCQPNGCGPTATVPGNWLAPGEDGARRCERRIRDFSPPLNRRTPLRTSPADRPRPCSSPKPALFEGLLEVRLPRSCATIFGAGNPPTGIR